MVNTLEKALQVLLEVAKIQYHLRLDFLVLGYILATPGFLPSDIILPTGRKISHRASGPTVSKTSQGWLTLGFGFALLHHFSKYWRSNSYRQPIQLQSVKIWSVLMPITKIESLKRNVGLWGCFFGFPPSFSIFAVMFPKREVSLLLIEVSRAASGFHSGGNSGIQGIHNEKCP